MPRLPNRPTRYTSSPFEVCEQRLVLSATGLVDMAIVETSADQSIELTQHNQGLPELGHHDIQLGQHLNGVHQSTGVDAAHDLFGFTGGNQTVAIIDSGIAYDHYALGGGFGPGHRVVGGWDFAENDANPFDDAPAGFHGTHVAGIVGSDNATHTGVAPGADLVALRVFDDQGGGNFDWVQGALQWVLDNQDAFENPITTVNMSLGAVGQNLQDVPWWQMLEPELQALNDAGIFVSVSAGNDFQEFGEKGLSYPAVSPWVVPVSSANDAGTQMSDFSQRDDRVLVAPGESIASTVPDELFSFDGVPNDWARASGTSMASPYVAGASVLLREAMDFMGHTDVTQDDLYNIFRDTSSLIYDDVTQTSYHFIDVEAALDTVVTDSHGNTVQAATAVGTLGDGSSFEGLVGRLDDVDYFTFTAGESGVMSLTATTTHDMTSLWQLEGGGGTADGDLLTFDVVAGESYTVSLASSTGHGHYTVDVAIEATTPPVEDLGQVDRVQLSDVAINGETWYQATATRDGILTIAAQHESAQGIVTLEVFTSEGQPLGSAVNVIDAQRTDVAVTAGETILFRLAGTNANVDLSLTNAIEINGEQVTVHGTDGNDLFTTSLGEGLLIDVNGVAYQLDAASLSNVEFSGGAGDDQIQITGTDQAESVVVNQGVTVTSGDVVIATDNVESILVDGGGGADAAILYDTVGDDVATVGQGSASLQGGGYDVRLDGFVDVSFYAVRGGADAIHFQDSVANDLFTARGSEATLVGGGFTSRAYGFATTTATSNAGGYDTARLYDTVDDDTLTARPDSVTMEGGGTSHTANNFEAVDAYSINGGQDTAVLFDSTGNDLFGSKDFISYMSGGGFINAAWYFQHVEAHGGAGGNDRAKLYDGHGDDVLTATDSRVEMRRSDGTVAAANNFSSVDAFANHGGHDTAVLQGSAGNDSFVASGSQATISGDGFINRVNQFESVMAYSSGGNDTATFYDTLDDDRLTMRPDAVTIEGGGYQHSAAGFATVNAYALYGGHDTAVFFDSAGNDLFGSKDKISYLFGAGFSNLAWYFEQVEAYGGSGGNDRVKLYDGRGDDLLISTGNQVSIQRADAADVTVSGFADVDAYAYHGGNDTAFLYGTAGDDYFHSSGHTATLSGDGFSNSVRDFETVQAQAGQGGRDTARLFDGVNDDSLVARPDEVTLLVDGVSRTAAGFHQVDVYALNGGTDTAVFFDSAGNDLFLSKDKLSYLQGEGFINIAWYFDHVEANSGAGGNDRAKLYDGSGDDVAHARGTQVEIQRAGTADVVVNGFNKVTAQSVRGGSDSAYFHDIAGDQTLSGSGNTATLLSDGATTSLYGFDYLSATAAEGESPHAELLAVDYLFDLFGEWD